MSSYYAKKSSFSHLDMTVLLRESMQAFIDSGSNIIVSIADESINDKRPEVFRFVSKDSLTVDVLPTKNSEMSLI